jgi:hypothetical protein
VTWTEALAAFSFARVASFIPITPGGLGTVDAALTALLTSYGATGSQALAADLVAGRDLRPPGAARGSDLPVVAGHGHPAASSGSPGLARAASETQRDTRFPRIG